MGKSPARSSHSESAFRRRSNIRPKLGPKAADDVGEHDLKQCWVAILAADAAGYSCLTAAAWALGAA